MLRGVKEDFFFTYGYSEEYAKSLCSCSKQVMSNAFVGASFKSHLKEMLDMHHRDNI